ncbi:MAG: RnfABCDGE type electron transport complex subunit D [Christensenellaceae bacterium]|jgi:electron transport complex protein RnfD|nr:RnfABCDGE type electron transport complex subunit D [Christensenellaceae bacterium]
MELHVSNAPQIYAKDSTRTLMYDVILALLLPSFAGIWFFGLRAALVLVIAIAAAVLSEYGYQKILHKPVTINDLSAVVTGLLLGLNLPVSAPWWLPVIGSVFAIVLIKQLFGGLGDNFLNPALSARAVLLASWPTLMTNFTRPGPSLDAVSSATVLSGYPSIPLQMFIGNIPGTIGEVSKAAILLGFLYLLLRGVISWRIPVVFVGAYALLALMLGNDVLTGVLSGGLLFGAVFMAPDYTTSPMTAKGQYIFAAACGLIVALIRNFGAYPEGVTYAILLLNIVTPLIDRSVKNKVYGKGKQ